MEIHLACYPFQYLAGTSEKSLLECSEGFEITLKATNQMTLQNLGHIRNPDTGQRRMAKTRVLSISMIFSKILAAILVG